MKCCSNFLTLFLLLLASTAFAQNVGKIAGIVSDRVSKEPIPGAHVLIKGTHIGAATNPDGTYFILNVPPGQYEVAVSMVGFQTVVQQQVLVVSSRTTTLNFALNQTAVDLPEVMIVAKRPDVEIDKTTSSLVVRPEEVLTLPSMANLNDLLTLSSDVVEGHFRGGREGEALSHVPPDLCR